MTSLKHLLILICLTLLLPASSFAEKIVFASPDDLPPKVYKDNGELKGVYVDIIREICKRMKVDAEFVTFPWARAVVMAREGKVDAFFPPFITEDRKQFLYFSSEPMTFTRNVVFALKKKHIIVKNLGDLQGLVVGINSQYSCGAEFDSYKKNLSLDLSVDEEMLIKKLGRSDRVKRIDVAIASEEAFKFLSQRLGYAQDFEPIYLLSESPSYVAFSKIKGEKAKVQAERFSKTLVKLKKEGFVQKTIEKYIE